MRSIAHVLTTHDLFSHELTIQHPAARRLCVSSKTRLDHELLADTFCVARIEFCFADVSVQVERLISQTASTCWRSARTHFILLSICSTSQILDHLPAISSTMTQPAFQLALLHRHLYYPGSTTAMTTLFSYPNVIAVSAYYKMHFDCSTLTVDTIRFFGNLFHTATTHAQSLVLLILIKLIVAPSSSFHISADVTTLSITSNHHNLEPELD
jgi:hypothetical protein